MMQTLPLNDIPTLKTLALFYPSLPPEGYEGEWEDQGEVWLQVVEKFIESRAMNHLEDLMISCMGPIRLATAIGKKAPNLKRLALIDLASSRLLPNYNSANI
jgi:hypothetical protein